MRWVLLFLMGTTARAQMHDMQNMQGMNHNFAGMYLMQQASGTSMNPAVVGHADDHEGGARLAAHDHGQRLSCGGPAERAARRR